MANHELARAWILVEPMDGEEKIKTAFRKVDLVKEQTAYLVGLEMGRRTRR